MQEIIWGLIGALWAANSLPPTPPVSPYMMGVRISLALVFVLDKMALYTSADTTHCRLLPGQQLPKAGARRTAELQNLQNHRTHFCLDLSSVSLDANPVWWLWPGWLGWRQGIKKRWLWAGLDGLVGEKHGRGHFRKGCSMELRRGPLYLEKWHQFGVLVG